MIKLEGRLSGPWVGELDRTWRSIVPRLAARKVSLDLRAVASVDADGRRLLREIYQKGGAAFLADTPLTRYFVEQATRNGRESGGEGA
jgi:hypothetical protein